MTQVQLPYFDFLLSQLDQRNASIETSFGRHVHWGYWPAPRRALLSDADFAIAAERLTQEICALADLADGHLVLDVGCGFGGTIAFLNERFDAMQLLGVNIDPRQLDRAKRLVLPLKHNTIAFQEGDACALPFPDASFDRVLAVECIFHFPSRETFFQEACRVLKPGGLLTLSDFLPSKAFAPFCRPRKPGRHNAFGSIDDRQTIDMVGNERTDDLLKVAILRQGDNGRAHDVTDFHAFALLYSFIAFSRPSSTTIRTARAPLRRVSVFSTYSFSTYSDGSRFSGGRPIPKRRRGISFMPPKASKIDSNPLCPPEDPPNRIRGCPSGKSRSSQTISNSAGLHL